MTRVCGRCSLCCKLLEIAPDEGFPQGKPSGQWCQHCRPGKGGCAIYPERPQVCRDFKCQWLEDESLGDEWYPARSRMVLSTLMVKGKPMMLVDVDPSYGDQWRKPRYHTQLKQFAQRMTVEISVGRERFQVTP